MIAQQTLDQTWKYSANFYIVERNTVLKTNGQNLRHLRELSGGIRTQYPVFNRKEQDVGRVVHILWSKPLGGAQLVAGRKTKAGTIGNTDKNKN